MLWGTPRSIYPELYRAVCPGLKGKGCSCSQQQLSRSKTKERGDIWGCSASDLLCLLLHNTLSQASWMFAAAAIATVSTAAPTACVLHHTLYSQASSAAIDYRHSLLEVMFPRPCSACHHTLRAGHIPWANLVIGQYVKLQNAGMCTRSTHKAEAATNLGCTHADVATISTHIHAACLCHMHWQAVSG